MSKIEEVAGQISVKVRALNDAKGKVAEAEKVLKEHKATAERLVSECDGLEKQLIALARAE